MEERYKTALEIILNLCAKDRYPSAEDIKLICETALKKEGEQDASA